VVSPARTVRGALPAARGALLAIALLVCTPISALAAGSLKVVRFHGYKVTVPRGWPVYDLTKDRTVCVRFNRHAVYLGHPGASERCPAQAAGRTEAILLQTDVAQAAGAGAVLASSTGLTGSSAGSLLNAADRVLATATWGTNPNLIRRALGVRSLRALTSVSSARAAADTMAPRLHARIATAAPSPGGVYTGLGFDVCSTPSAAQMSAWASSSYHAIGVYVGGTNMACTQPNLSAAWVSQESAAGWHLIPIYVGLQAPSNSCGCAAISKSGAASEGRAAAIDAVGNEQALGMGPGNPVYFDMEAYPRGSTNSPAVLAFLTSWTDQLRAEGYKSGVYSSEYAGISDLVSQYGMGYSEPDQIWIANWNGVKSTTDSDVPPIEWADHQRLHQYSGGHDETHGGVTLNIDGDYVDAGTAAAGSAANAAAEPSASSPPAIYGSVGPGQTLTDAHGTWPGTPTAYSYQWEDCNTAGYSCLAIPGATGQSYALAASDIGHAIRVIEAAVYPGGSAIPAISQATSEVMSPVPLYWLYTAHGNIYPSPGTAWYRSPATNGFRGSSIRGMAATPDGKGYWEVGAAGHVFAYGDATLYAAEQHPRPISGLVAAPGGGLWLYTAYGNVWPSSGAAWYGSPYASGFRGSSITGMAATPDGNGYWLVNAAGRVFSFGDAASEPRISHAHPIKGIVAATGGGYWLYTAHGNVYPSFGRAWYRSPAANGFRGSSITGMAASPDGMGYWLVDAAGTVFAYGDAGSYPAPVHAYPISGVAGG
jgi:hypothetical protein